MNYLDTSALIKRFVQEKGSRLVQTLMGQGEPIATAKIAYIEVYAGLNRKFREGHLSRMHHTRACKQFETDWTAYIRVDLQDEILRLARDLIQRHPLKGFDAVHLTSALELRNALGEGVTFVAADERLLRAARTENLGILHAETVEVQ